MTNMSLVLAWKFPGQQGMSTDGVDVTKFPGEIPSQVEQDLWKSEYDLYFVTLTQITAINDLRDQKMSSDFTHAGQVIDADQSAQMAIAHAISYGQLNTIPDVTTRTWTLADNTVQTVTWGVFRAMASAMFERASILHGEARAHKDAIKLIVDGPGTNAEKVVLIEAYDVNTSWVV